MTSPNTLTRSCSINTSLVQGISAAPAYVHWQSTLPGIVTAFQDTCKCVLSLPHVQHLITHLTPDLRTICIAFLCPLTLHYGDKNTEARSRVKPFSPHLVQDLDAFNAALNHVHGPGPVRDFLRQTVDNIRYVLDNYCHLLFLIYLPKIDFQEHVHRVASEMADRASAADIPRSRLADTYMHGIFLIFATEFATLCNRMMHNNTSDDVCTALSDFATTSATTSTSSPRPPSTSATCPSHLGTQLPPPT